MQPLDPLRFIYSLAGMLLGAEWTGDGIKSSLKRPVMDHPLRVPKLAERIAAAFPARPRFDSLFEFLKADAGLLRALRRGSIPPVSRLGRSSKAPPPINRAIGSELPDLPTEAALAKWLNVDPPHLRWYADITGRNRRHRPGPLRTYNYRWIPKSNGQPRLLEIPRHNLRRIQRKILAEILDRIPAHRCAHGFVKGRSIITNASAHCGKDIVLRFDLTDFFPSIRSARVFRIFRTIGYPIDVARFLMGLCTTSLPADVWDTRPGARISADFLRRQCLITRHLPQGAPTSPALANLAAHRLDRRLAALAIQLNATYTRYADDLTFSGPIDLARSRKRLATLIAVIADDEGFLLNHRKTRIQRASLRQHVTGVVVNVRPNIARAEYDTLKAILTNCIRHGPDSQNRPGHRDFRAHLAGRISQVQAVHPARGEKLRMLFAKIRWS